MLGDRTLKPKPSTCGTITYIAPETEVTKYSYLVNSYSTLIEILAFEPKERPKASEALQHPALQKKVEKK
ncbi:hypothetical protein UCDDS831_g04820 [Diplodia seriata]|uniref:Protein kinase domain-containing protein n=1 Tax=Diplodia seriata TaxID=420778 RepID=A0A0G2EDN0_9PEZI|nr:hypothetical protein UCDDS831_g04820 [Diplodia seriata]